MAARGAVATGTADGSGLISVTVDGAVCIGEDLAVAAEASATSGADACTTVTALCGSIREVRSKGLDIGIAAVPAVAALARSAVSAGGSEAGVASCRSAPR